MRAQFHWTRVQATAARTSCPQSFRLHTPLSRRQLHTGPLLRRSRPQSSLFSHPQQIRHASSELNAEVAKNEIKGDARSSSTRLKNLIYGTGIVIALTSTYLYITDTRATIHQWLVVPTLRTLYPDAEDAHQIGNKALKALYTFGLHPRERGDPDAKGDLRVEIFGTVIDNPIGTSAGLDKNAEIPDPVFALGPGLVEVGGITPIPQEGNPKPRVWRIPSQNALINRYGLNSEGAVNVAVRLRQRLRQFARSIGLGLDAEAERQVLDGEVGVPPGSQMPGRLLAVQIAKMKNTPDTDLDAVACDYVYCVDQVAKYADVIVVNVSSPNTPGLRSLQQSAPLTKILTSVVEAARATDRKTKPAVMVKVSPDEDSEEQVSGICGAVWASGVDGIIVGNTTKKRPDPLPKGYALSAKEEQIIIEQGGYSGPQMFERTLALVKTYRRVLDQGPDEANPPKQQSKQQPKQESKEEPPKASEQAPVATTDPADGLTEQKIQEGVERDTQRLKPLTPEADEASSQPLIRIPERHSSDQALVESLQSSEPALSASTHAVQGTASTPTSTSPASTASASTSATAPQTTAPEQTEEPLQRQKDKVIFATGGITNGKQALEILNAGASIAMVYTALVYGGAGTISRIKKEMREEMGTNKKN